MKKNIYNVRIFLVLLISTFSFSQVSYGVKAGMQRTNVTNYHPDSSPRYGFQIGGFAQIPLGDSNKWVFQPELLYMNHGEKNTLNGKEEKYFINYIAVPLNIKWFLSDNEDSFFVEAGPQIAIKLNKNTKGSDTTYWENLNGSYGKEYDKVSALDISLGLGLGYSFNRELDFGFKINYGLSDVYSNSIGENKAKTNGTFAIGFSVGYIIY